MSLDESTAFSNRVKYRQVVSSLQYVTLSRPDIAFAVNNVCQYMHASMKNDWSTVKRILHYLHGTVEHGMLIRRSSGFTLQAFTDVLWKEVEYKALADTVAELTWLQALLNELGIRSSSTPIIWCDDLGATYLSANSIFHACTKHVEIDYHFVWEKGFSTKFNSEAISGSVGQPIQECSNGRSGFSLMGLLAINNVLFKVIKNILLILKFEVTQQKYKCVTELSSSADIPDSFFEDVKEL
ncbi:uncharacterized mitochondrial protein-like protein [Tanacetum coccineum]